MTYVYQWFGAMTGWAFFYGCMLGMASPMAYRTRPLPATANANILHAVPHVATGDSMGATRA